MQKSEIELLSYTTHKIDMKWVKDLNLRLDTIKLLRENMGRSSLAFVWSMIFFFFFFFAGGLWHQKHKQRFYMWNYIKLKGFCIGNETTEKQKGSTWNGRKYLNP